MEYSPISKLYIENFRNLGAVEIDFSQSPIVCLVGENEAGKTSVIKAFSVCALHATPRDQKDFIRTGTSRFGVAIDLVDGTRILRIKELKGGNRYSVIYPDKTTWNMDKISEGLPSEVSKLMGLVCEPETGEFLHIRTYEDRLLFVVTPNSVNYKVMYNSLKVEQLTKAIKLGSTEANEYKSNINRNEIAVNTLKNQLDQLCVVDTTSLSPIKQSLQRQLDVLNKVEKLLTLKNRIESYENELGAIILIDKFKLTEIDQSLSSKLHSVYKSLNTINSISEILSNISIIDSIGEIDVSLITKLQNVVIKLHNLNEKSNETSAIQHISDLSEISEVLLSHLNNAKQRLNQIETAKSEIKLLNIDSAKEVATSDIECLTKVYKAITFKYDSIAKLNEKKSYDDYIEQVHQYLKQCGVAVESCPKCGEAVIFDIDKIGIA